MKKEECGAGSHSTKDDKLWKITKCMALIFLSGKQPILKFRIRIRLCR